MSTTSVCPWADCACTTGGTACGCGGGCTCGTLTHAAFASFKAATCPWSDCSCGDGCGCGAGCSCTGGATAKTDTEWLAAAKKGAALDARACGTVAK